MANPIKIRRMSFTDADGHITWGWTVQNNYVCLFDDTLEQEDVIAKGVDFLRKIITRTQGCTYVDKQIRELLLTCWSSERGLYIDGFFTTIQ